MATTTCTKELPSGTYSTTLRPGRGVFPGPARRLRAAAVLGLLLLQAFAAVAFGQTMTGQEVSPARMQSGSLLFRMRQGYTVATRINTDVEIEVSGPVARTTVRQEFRNDGAEWVEGVYVFPLPEDAAVDRLRMRIGERFIEGEIREKEQARKEYEAAKAAGKRTGLVEQQRANLFTTSVANVGPGATVVIEIGYQETLAFDDGVFSMRLPLTLTPRYIPGTPLPDRRGSGWSADTDRVRDASLITPPVVTQSTDHRLTLHASIDAGIPLEYVVSRYHPVTITTAGGGETRYDVEFAAGDIPMDHDFELSWKSVPSAMPRASLFSETVGGYTHYLLLMLPPTDDSAAGEPMPRELVFIIDTSGSMHGVSIQQAKEALLLALDDLRAVDRFNVIQFNSYTHALFGDSVPATPANVQSARDYVAALEANGGTNMRPALERALAGHASETHLKQVVFITDGAVGNEAELYNVIESELGAARLFTVGIGSAPNGWFMRKAAEAGRGSFTTVSALHEVHEKMERLFEKLRKPKVTGIEVSWPGADSLAYPETVPDLYAGEPVIVTARLSTVPRTGDLVSIAGQSTAGGWSRQLTLAPGDRHAGIGAVWARARIADLLDRERRGADPEQIRAAVIGTAIDHHLVSPYTSLVAVDKTPVRPDSAALTKEQVPNVLPYGQSHRAIFGFPATATGWQAQAAAGTVLILLALLLAAFIRLLKRSLTPDAAASL